MITITTDTKTFLIYKSLLSEIGDGYTIEIQNNISKRKVASAYTVTELLNSYKITLSADVSSLKSKCTLYIYDENGVCVYKEPTTIK